MLLTYSGRGLEPEGTDAKIHAKLRAHSKSRIEQLWSALVREAEADIRLGRICPRQSIDEVDLAGLLIDPRFGIVSSLLTEVTRALC